MEVDALGAAALMRASPVFHKMLTHDMQEKARGTISLPGKNAQEFRTFMSFILPGTSRQAQLDEHNVGFMWRLCHEYMLKHCRRNVKIS